jgi:chromosomal replication initiation ATPase DnaA
MENHKFREIWTEKYSLEKISDIQGSEMQIRQIKDWLSKYETNRRSIMIKKNEKKKGKKNRRRKVLDKSCGDLLINEGEGEEKIENFDPKILDSENELPQKTKEKKKNPNECSCMILIGDNGCGKTAIIRAILKEMGYSIRNVTISDIGKKNTIDDYIRNLLFGNNIHDIISNTVHLKKAVIVDEIESITTHAEKQVILEILKLNNETWACPVIFIGNRKHRKIIMEVIKESYHVRIYDPRMQEMANVFTKIAIGEGMIFQNDNAVANIIRHSQSDYRRMILTMQELYSLYGNTEITLSFLETYFKYSDHKDVESTIYEKTTKLFCEYGGIKKALSIFWNDKINIPLMVQQNHFTVLSKYCMDKSKMLELAADVAASIATGDIIDNYIYSEQTWSLQELHGFFTCVYPTFILSKNIDREGLKRDSIYPLYKPAFTCAYPKDLNKTSTRKINTRNVKISNRYFPNMNVDDYISASGIIKILLENDQVDKCRKILEKYKINHEIIKYVLKIDKVNGTKKEIPKNLEKKIKEIFSDNTRPSRSVKMTKKSKQN